MTDRERERERTLAMLTRCADRQGRGALCARHLFDEWLICTICGLSLRELLQSRA